MKKEEIKQLDEFASRAMQGIVSGIYNNPAMLEILDKLAGENKQSTVMEISERSYLIAHAMLKKRQKMIHETED